MPRFALAVDEGSTPDLPNRFDPRVREVWLEIGFGGGEHLIWQARTHPDVGIVGCETYEDGVVKVLSALETERQTNVKLWAADARESNRTASRSLPWTCVHPVPGPVAEETAP